MTLEIDTGTGLMPVHEWGSTDGDTPGLLLLQEIFGVSDYIKQRGADLAALGYYVIAPEIYWRLDDTVAGRVRPRVCCSAPWASCSGSTGARPCRTRSRRWTSCVPAARAPGSSASASVAFLHQHMRQLQRIALHRLGTLRSVRNACRVAEIDNCFVWQPLT